MSSASKPLKLPAAQVTRSQKKRVKLPTLLWRQLRIGPAGLRKRLQILHPKQQPKRKLRCPQREKLSAMQANSLSYCYRRYAEGEEFHPKHGGFSRDTAPTDLSRTADTRD